MVWDDHPPLCRAVIIDPVTACLMVEFEAVCEKDFDDCFGGKGGYLSHAIPGGGSPGYSSHPERSRRVFSCLRGML